jgi:hypothetical protein
VCAASYGFCFLDDAPVCTKSIRASLDELVPAGRLVVCAYAGYKRQRLVVGKRGRCLLVLLESFQAPVGESV